MREKTELPPNESQTYSSGNSNGPPDLRLVHYNDVYHIDASSAEPVGGAARFISLMEHYRHDDKFKGQSDLITLFSGDAFNPSLESSITKGRSQVHAWFPLHGLHSLPTATWNLPPVAPKPTLVLTKTGRNSHGTHLEQHWNRCCSHWGMFTLREISC